MFLLFRFSRSLLLAFCLVVHPLGGWAAEKPAEKNANLKKKLETVFSNFLRRELTIGEIRWIFWPTHVAGKNLKLWEAPNVLMAEAPRAKMVISWKTLTSGRLRVGKMQFQDAQLYLRYTHDGKMNLTSMVADLAANARKIYVPGQKQKVAYNIFRIDNAKLHVIDVENGATPFNEPFIVNARGDIGGLGPDTQFPFTLTAVLPSTATPVNFDIKGTISSRPHVRAVVRRLPVQALLMYLPVVRWFNGELNAEADVSKAGQYSFWKVRFAGDGIKTWADLPFPEIKVDGFLHPYARSTLNVSLLGKPTRVDAVVNIRDLVKKKAALTVKTEKADVAEILRWFRSGYLMAANSSPEQLAEEAKQPLVWDVSGDADVSAELVSTLGPKLIRDADGQITFLLRDGKLTQMPGFVKALAILKRSGLRQNGGLPFNTIAGVIDVKDGVAEARNEIALSSTLLNIGFTGHINFSKNVINARMRLGSVWFVVKGPLDNPAVQRLKT